MVPTSIVARGVIGGGNGRSSRDASTPTHVKGDGRVRQIEQAAAELFFRRGYQSTSLRDIAQAVGIRPASLYHHFPSKQDLLFAVLNRTIDDLIDRGEQVLMTELDPVAQLRGLASEFVLYVAERPREGMVGDTEIEHLDDGNRATLLSKRDRYQRILEQVVAAGNLQGCFAVVDVKLTVYAILGMCNHVTIWFRPGGRRVAADVAQEYADLALRMVAHQSLAACSAASGHPPTKSS